MNSMRLDAIAPLTPPRTKLPIQPLTHLHQTMNALLETAMATSASQTASLTKLLEITVITALVIIILSVHQGIATSKRLANQTALLLRHQVITQMDAIAIMELNANHNYV
jgi:hypothetical protein